MLLNIVSSLIVTIIFTIACILLIGIPKGTDFIGIGLVFLIIFIKNKYDWRTK